MLQWKFCMMTMARSLGLLRRLFILLTHKKLLKKFSQSWNFRYLIKCCLARCNVLSSVWCADDSCHDSSARSLVAWPLGPTGTVFAANYSARQNKTAHSLIPIDYLTSNMILRPGYWLKDNVIKAVPLAIEITQRDHHPYDAILTIPFFVSFLFN